MSTGNPPANRTLKILPPGRYHKPVVAEHGLVHCGRRGTPSVRVRFMVDFLGETYDTFWDGFLTPNGLPVALKALRVLGWAGTDVFELHTEDVLLDGSQTSILTELVEVEIPGTDPVEKRELSIVRWVDRIGGRAMLGRMPDTAAKLLSKQLREKIETIRSEGHGHPRYWFKHGRQVNTEEES